MTSDRSVLERQFDHVELRPFTLEGFHRRRQRRERNRRIGTAVVAFAIVAAAFGGLARAITAGGGTIPAQRPPNSFAGSWVSIDSDGSSQTMTIQASPEGAYEMVLHDDMTGPCSGPSTDTGAGRLDDAGSLVVRSIKTSCENGRTPDGAGDSLIFVYDAETDRITDDVGVVWRREPAED
jgi:hypothetical protein